MFAWLLQRTIVVYKFPIFHIGSKDVLGFLTKLNPKGISSWISFKYFIFMKNILIKTKISTKQKIKLGFAESVKSEIIHQNMLGLWFPHTYNPVSCLSPWWGAKLLLSKYYVHPSLSYCFTQPKIIILARCSLLIHNGIQCITCATCYLGQNKLS